MSAATLNPDPLHDWPLWWFSRLEAAVERGDHIAAADAQRELARLGVKVCYGLPRREQSAEVPVRAPDAPR